MTSLVTTDGRVTGVRADVLAPDAAGRGEPSNRRVERQVELGAGAVVVASGGIGANHELVRASWPASAGRLPDAMLSGVPDSTDGHMLARAADAGAAPGDGTGRTARGVRYGRRRRRPRSRPGPTSRAVDRSARGKPRDPGDRVTFLAVNDPSVPAFSPIIDQAVLVMREISG